MEMMVVLLIVAIIAAATAPMVSKKMSRNAGSGDSPWVFTGLNNSIAYNMNGSNASALIGTSRYNRGDNGPQYPRLVLASGNDGQHPAFAFADANGNFSGQMNMNQASGIVTLNNAAVGNNSTAIGMGQTIENSPSGIVAIGQGLGVAGGSDDSIAIGKGVEVNGVNAIAIGNKDPNVSVDTTSATGENTIAIGQSSRAISENSLAIGLNAVADGGSNQWREQGAIAIGNHTEAIGQSAIAIGSPGSSHLDTSANGESSIAIGPGAQATKKFSCAIGENSTAEHEYSVAIGQASRTTAAHQIVLGNTGISGIAGSANTTVYIPGNLVVGGNAYIGTRITPASYGGGYSSSLFLKFTNGVIKNVREESGDSNKLTLGPHMGTNDVTLDKAYTSDRRLKNVGEKYTAGLNELKQLDFFHFTFKKDEEKTPHVGVMAQDLEKVFPDAVTKGEDGYLRIRFEDMFYAVINAVKELDNKITEIVNNITQINAIDKKQNETIESMQATIDSQQKTIELLQKDNEELKSQKEIIAEQQKLIKKLEKRIEKLES